ncbi:MAG: phenylalanine--tRNA ligase subunit alpha, partial [Myxococcaceae bacterium]
MQEKLSALAEEAKREIGRAENAEQVEALRVKYLGKKGQLSAVLGGMGKLSPDERRSLGEVANRVKGELEGLLEGAVRRAEEQKLE